MAAKIFRINYKSDFILTMQSDAGWATPFCIKFWTGAPSIAYFAGWDGTTYVHCALDGEDPTKLHVHFDDHHLPIGDLKFQIAYHFTVEDFPNNTEDEVINQAAVIIDQDGTQMQVMLDLNGETAPEIEFNLPAYANEAQRIANENQRIANEAQRIANEEQRIANEEQRISNEEQRIAAESIRIANEESRISEFAQLKHDAEIATADANAAATLANEKAALAAEKAALSQAAAELANAKAALAQQKADYAQTQGDYAKAQGDYAKEQGNIAEADHERAESDHTRAENDHTAVEVYVDSLGAFDISAYHATGGVLAKYVDLSAALDGGNNIPEAIRKGGMSVKFVQSSDNKYVQYRLMHPLDNASTAADDFTNTANWQGVDDEPTAGSDNLVKSGGVSEKLTELAGLIGYYQASLVENASTLVYKTVITNLGISQGEPFNFILTGTHSGNRILLKYNTTSGTTIQDFCVIGTRYYKTAEVELNSIVLYHNGDIDISLEIDKNIKCQIEKNTASIETLNDNTSALADNVASLNAEVFNEETTLIDTTGTAPTEQYIDFFAVAGTEVTVEVKSLSNQSVTITAVTSQNIVKETIHSGSLTDGQVVTDTFSPTRNIYKIRILASSRGKLEITTINTSLKEKLTKTIDDVSDRLSVVEQDISGSEKSEEFNVSEFDMVNNDTIDIPISGSAYSLVKFCIDNPNDVTVQVKLFYRKTNQTSVELGLFSVSDRNIAEVIYEIPVDFISLRYAVYNSQRRIITLRTELNPYIEDNGFEEAVSSNVLDISALTTGHDMKPDGTEIVDSGRSYTDYIRVREGNVVVLSNDVETLEQVNSTGRILNPRPLNMRFIAAYDYNKNVLSELAPDSSVNHTSYVVPKGVYYIRVSANTSYLTGSGARINLGGIILPYEQYWKGIRPTGVTANSEEIKSMYNFPVTKMPMYLRNIVSYRPLGQLSKGYLSVSDDDGTIGLGTYTLPMVIQKDVPVTFSVMKDSAIFQDGNEQYKALLLDAINNHNCTLAQHGGINWTDYNEKQLYDFFEREKLYWDSLGVEVNAAVAPSHYVTKVIEAVSGGYFGVLRCGYEGQNADSTPNYETIHTSNYACIPRTNIFCLPSLNVRDKSLQGWKDTIDWAVENKLLLNVYFHDFDFVETATDYVARRELLEDFFDYAKEHITMVNLEDIPRLV